MIRKLLCLLGLHKRVLVGWAQDRHGNRYLESECVRCGTLKTHKLRPD